jgi:hypothetical protein
MTKRTVRLTESELRNIIMESVKKILREGQNDTPSNTHYAIHKPSNKIVFSWDYTGYDPEELRTFKKDYFVVDLLDMEMDPKEVTIWTRNSCIKKGIDPADDANWSNYPMAESCKKLNEGTHSTDIKTIVLSIGDFEYENEDLNNWITDNWDSLPTEDVNIEIDFTYVPEDKGDYWTPPSGDYITVNDVTVSSDETFEYIKQNLGEEAVKEIISTIESYVYDNADELIQYDYDDYGPDPDEAYERWRESRYED